jgi:carbonic anhydrase
MKDYIAHYTRNYNNHLDIASSMFETLHLRLEKGENLEKKVDETFNNIINNPKENNKSVQIHGFYEIAKEIKLQNYNFSKKY